MSKKYKSVFKYDGENADDKPLSLEPGDELTFQLLRRFSYLPASWIFELTVDTTGLSPQQKIDKFKRFRHRLARLARYRYKFDSAGNPKLNSPLEQPYLDRAREWYKEADYSLNRYHVRFKDIVDRRNETKDHAIIANIVAASLLIGAREHNTTLKLWDQLVQEGWTENGLTQRIPSETLRLTNPFKIPLEKNHIIPDWPIFSVEQRDRQVFFVSEIDRDTEDGYSDNKLDTIEWKFKHYQEVIRKQLYASHFNFPNIVVLWVTISERRKKQLMEILQDVLHQPHCKCDKSSRAGREQHARALAQIRCTYHAFTTGQDWNQSTTKYPAPSGTYFTRPYDRIGCRPYSLLKLGDA